MLLLATQDALGQVRRYRIELLVLTHINPPASLIPEVEITDYSAALDLQMPADTDSSTGRTSQAAQLPAVSMTPHATGAASGVLAPAAAVSAEDPLALVWIETPSDTMQQAWRRLRSSSGFRPEVYFSWEQSNQQPFPLLRVHDATALFEEEPFTGSQTATATTRASDQYPGHAGGGGAIEPLPEVTRFYRIDGTANFRKTRFLHLDLDLELRTPLPASNGGIAGEALFRTSAFEVFSIRQSRRVQTRDIEYFDGPVIGVLALISRIETETDPSPADPDEAVPASEVDVELSD